MGGMPETDLQSLCERGQQELMCTQYLSAVHTLVEAEQRAWDLHDFDTLSRLYLPLQEARRQIRQRCGEGAVALHCVAPGSAAVIDPETLIQQYPTGQLLIAGWGTIQPAIQLRKLAAERSLYLETFLAATYPVIDDDPVIAIVPIESPMPAPPPRQVAELALLVPAGTLLVPVDQLPADAAKGTANSYAQVMAIWERLHLPFLNAASTEPDPIRRMQRYRLTLRVDPACELAHQFLADIARKLARGS
jgi:hypothetical protein